jgi:hypothetical protein
MSGKVMLSSCLLVVGLATTLYQISRYRKKGIEAFKEDLLGICFNTWPSLVFGIGLTLLSALWLLALVNESCGHQ